MGFCMGPRGLGLLTGWGTELQCKLHEEKLAPVSIGANCCRQWHLGALVSLSAPQAGRP